MGVLREDVRTSFIVRNMFELPHRIVVRRLGIRRPVLALSAAAFLAHPGSLCAQAASPATSPLDTGALTLRTVLGAVTADHPLVLAAQARVAAARARRATAGVFGNPVVTYQVENASIPGRPSPVGLAQETSTFATLPLEQLWQRKARVGRANEDLIATEADLITTRRSAALEAARAFHRVALAQFSADATGEVIVGLDSLVRYTRTRVTEGATAEGDLLRLEVERDRVATDRALQESELAEARAALQPYLANAGTPTGAAPALETIRVAVAVGVVGSDGAPGSATLAGAPELSSRSGLGAFALATRPDVLSARGRARAAGAEVGLQGALTVRQLGATIGTKLTDGSYSLIAGLSLPVPLFDRNRGEVQRARAEHVAAEQELRWIELRAVGEVVGAFESARILTARIAALQTRFLARAEASRGVALAAYREGAAPLLSVLDATRTLADARLSYLRARYAQQDAVLALYVAAGLDPSRALATTSPTRTAP